MNGTCKAGINCITNETATSPTATSFVVIWTPVVRKKHADTMLRMQTKHIQSAIS
jgi:hypothetical protein